MKFTRSDGYSAEVELYLEIGDVRLQVCQLGPEEVTLLRKSELPVVDAKVVVVVDGHKTVYDVRLHEGSTGETKIVNFQRTTPPPVPF